MDDLIKNAEKFIAGHLQEEFTLDEIADFIPSVEREKNKTAIIVQDVGSPTAAYVFFRINFSPS